MIIAIIDDGICSEEITSVIEVHCVGRFENATFKQGKHDSHATVCAKIIEKYSSPSKIIDIPILDENESANISDMCTALENCQNMLVDVINLSCGSAFFCRNTVEYDRLKTICSKLYYRGVKIFAAQNNDGQLTIPAELPYVTSVEQYYKEDISKNSLFRRSDIYTEGAHWIKINNKKKKTKKCNSFACAYASACEIAGKRAAFIRYMISDTFNASLELYNSNKISDNIIELYLDDATSPAGRLYFNEPDGSEKRYLKKNKLRSLVLKDSEEHIRFITECSEGYKDADIPFVYVQKCEKAIETAIRLDNEFISNRYKSAVVSSDKQDVLSGAFFSPDCCIEEFSKFIAINNSCNILIIICDEFQKKNEDDIYITIDNNEYTIAFNKETKKIDSYDKLYNEIINFFK